MFFFEFKKNLRKIWFLFFLGLLQGCTYTCSGGASKGSMKNPIRVALSSEINIPSLSLKKLSECLLENTKYAFEFESFGSSLLSVSAVGQQTVDLSVAPIFDFLSQENLYSLVVSHVVSSEGLPVNRSVLLGYYEKWKASYEGKEGSYLQPLQNRRMIYVSLESDLGFWVPQYMLLQENIFPQEAIFAGSYEAVLMALKKGLGQVGAVSENWLRDFFHYEGYLKPGVQIGDFVILQVSQSLPGKVIILSKEIKESSPLWLQSFILGMKQCEEKEKETIFQILEGENFIESQEKMFVHARELWQLRQKYLRAVDPYPQNQKK